MGLRLNRPGAVISGLKPTFATNRPRNRPRNRRLKRTSKCILWSSYVLSIPAEGVVRHTVGCILLLSGRDKTHSNTLKDVGVKTFSVLSDFDVIIRRSL